MKHWQQAEMAQCYQNIGISVMITIIIMIFCHDQLKLALWSQFLLKSRCEMFVVIKYGETRLIVREKRTEEQKKVEFWSKKWQQSKISLNLKNAFVCRQFSRDGQKPSVLLLAPQTHPKSRQLHNFNNRLVFNDLNETSKLISRGWLLMEHKSNRQPLFRNVIYL